MIRALHEENILHAFFVRNALIIVKIKGCCGIKADVATIL
jgi:hypothetical protein